nr:putative ribonuclease h protein [Quercus suber]
MFCAGKQGRAVTKEVKRVCWSRPNPGRAGGGGLIRDAHGGWVKGFTRNIGVATSVEAELWALRGMA